ncbi:hypothetical protein N9O45_03430 [Planktomarina temperata]|nr:hypothetical protein [Planktomarina temperata]
MRGDLVNAIFLQLEQHKLTYAVLRGANNLQDGTSDIDLWMSRRDLNLFTNITENERQRFKLRTSLTYSYKCLRISFYSVESLVVEFDIFFEIRRIFFEIVPNELILNHIEDRNGIKVLKNSVAFLIILNKEFITYGKLRSQTRREYEMFQCDTCFKHEIMEFARRYGLMSSKVIECPPENYDKVKLTLEYLRRKKTLIILKDIFVWYLCNKTNVLKFWNSYHE